MKPEGKARIIIFALISIVLAYFASGYTYELYELDIKSHLADVSSAENIVIDGSDFTPVFKLFGYGANGLIITVTSGVYAVVISVVSLILLLPFRAVGLNKKRSIGENECRIMKKLFIAVVVLSLLTGGIITRFSQIALLLLYNAVWIFWAYILCIFPLRKINKASG